MVSEISILRKFLSLKDNIIDTSFFVSNNKSYIRYMSTSTIFNHSMKIQLRSCGIVYIFDFQKNNSLYVNSSNLRLKYRIIDLDDFQNFDDISLVLKYGRDILDENLINSFNDRYDLELILSDFDAFLKL